VFLFAPPSVLPINAGVRLQETDLAVEGRPMKRRKIRDTNKDAKVESLKCIDLTVNKFKILTPNDSDSVRYYGREGMQELFDQLVDSREGVEDFNIEFIGAPGTGKSNLAWAVAEHLGTTEDVIWVGRRSNSHRWEVFQFRDGNVYGFDDLPKQLSDILELDAFDNSEVLIVDAPIDVSDAAQFNQGPAAYSWASNVAYHNSRRGKRRVIHVSSLGAAAKKEEDRRAINVEEKIMRPFTRRDYIEGLEDQELKVQVCKTLNIEDASSVTAEDLVDSKFYYSGINARWFFNFTIEKIKDECKKIIGRMDDSTVTTGDRHREAVNSALQRYQDDDRQVVLFTSCYLANAIGRNTSARNKFFEFYPLIKEHLGNGAPGEIFEADFAVHLHHCHDLAAAQHAVMGQRAQPTYVTMGTTSKKTMELWPTGKLYNLPAAAKDVTAHQSLPEDAIKDKDKASNVAQWFIPEGNSQPFLDFFVLVPVDAGEWQLRCIQNTVSRKHSADLEQLRRVVGGLLDSGYILHNTIVVAYIVKDLAEQGEVGLKQKNTIAVSRTTGTRSNTANQSQLQYTVDPLHVSYVRTGGVPS